MDKSEVLGTEKIPTLLWRFSIPAITGAVVNALYNVIDSIFVGHGVGDIGLTAVTIAFPLMLILMAIGMFVGVGAAALTSIRLGQKKKADAELILGNALTMLVVFVLVSTTIALFFLEPLLIRLGATPDVLPYAEDFSYVILLGSVFMHISFGLNGIISAQGDPKTALYTMLIASILNTILNPFFIFILGLGIKGSALATVTAQAVASVWVLRYFIKGQGTLKLRRANLRLRRDIVQGIAKIGLAPFIMQVCNGFVVFSLNSGLLKYGGPLAVASYGIIGRVNMLILMPVIGISQGAQPLIGYNFGSGQYQRVTETLKRAITAATVICLLGLVIIQLLSAQIIYTFNGSQEMVDIGSAGMKTFLLMLPLAGFQIIGANFFQSIGKARYSIVFNLLRQVILLIPLAFQLPTIFGLKGIWMAGPIADGASALLTGCFLILEISRLNKIAASQPALL